MTISKKHLILALVLVFTLIAVQGVTALGNETILACVHKTTGNVRIVASQSQCLPSERAESWSRQGPTGPQGPVGPAGPQGPEGPAGVSGWEKVDATLTFEHSGEGGIIGCAVECSDGKRVLGGGGAVDPYPEPPNPSTAEAVMVSSKPGWNDSSWVAGFRVVAGGVHTRVVRTWAICAYVD